MAEDQSIVGSLNDVDFIKFHLTFKAQIKLARNIVKELKLIKSKDDKHFQNLNESSKRFIEHSDSIGRIFGIYLKPNANKRYVTKPGVLEKRVFPQMETQINLLSEMFTEALVKLKLGKFSSAHKDLGKIHAFLDLLDNALTPYLKK